MTLYMAQFKYTPDAWAAFTKHPEDRTPAVEALAESLGCRFEAFYRYAVRRRLGSFDAESWNRGLATGRRGDRVMNA